MEFGAHTDRITVDQDILPLFVVKSTDPAELVSFAGTGFLIAPRILVTCWHCVKNMLPEGCRYAAVRSNGAGGHQALHLAHIEQDKQGSDLATAHIEASPTLGLKVAEGDVAVGTDVFSYGYPLTDVGRRAAGGMQFTLHARYLRGYVMRAFWYEHPQFGRVASYEVDMQTPEGLSGAPLIRRGSWDVVGVVYGTNEVASIAEFARHDPETDERTPELQRIVGFGLAHYTGTLHSLRTEATRDLPLSQFLRS
ncbi:MAG TPA: serine protease [Pyrinomonadaceae bacterium]|nr:serine protease [Pyrinomonadaceae bacterium]